VYALPPSQRTALIAGVAHLLDLGQRAIGEFLPELVDGDPAHLFVLLANYRRLDPALLQALGGDRWTVPLQHQAPSS
jgi:hypothetical protein